MSGSGRQISISPGVFCYLSKALIAFGKRHKRSFAHMNISIGNGNPVHCFSDRIIAVTAHARDSDKKLCLENDMDGFLSKPLSIEHLKDCLTEWDVLPAQPDRRASSA